MTLRVFYLTKVTELVYGRHLGLLTLCHAASLLASQSPPLSPSLKAAEEMTGSLEDGIDAVGLHLMMGPLEVFSLLMTTAERCFTYCIEI